MLDMADLSCRAVCILYLPSMKKFFLFLTVGQDGKWGGKRM